LSVTYLDGAADGFAGAAVGMLGAARRLMVKSQERSRKKRAVLIGGFFIVFVLRRRRESLSALRRKRQKGQSRIFFASMRLAFLRGAVPKERASLRGHSGDEWTVDEFLLDAHL
jgi:hypothetical protein